MASDQVEATSPILQETTNQVEESTHACSCVCQEKPDKTSKEAKLATHQEEICGEEKKEKGEEVIGEEEDTVAVSPIIREENPDRPSYEREKLEVEDDENDKEENDEEEMDI